MTPGRRLVSLWLTAAATLVLGAVVLEMGLRLFVDVTDVPFYFWDPLIGPRKAPNQTGRYLEGGFIRGAYHFNAQGWNYPEDFSVTRPPGASRVCLIGDSQVESLQVRPEETMYSVAERIARDSGTPVQWYPLGVSGYGTAQEYEVIRRYALDYRPDVVVLLFIQNDPFDTSPYIVDLEPYVARYVLDPAGDLSLFFPAPWEPRGWRRLGAQSALVRYFMVQKRLLAKLEGGSTVPGVGALPMRESTSEFRHPIVPGLASMSFAERQEMTWKLVARLLEAARDECQRRGAVLAVAFRGWGDEIDAPLHPETAPSIPKEQDPYCLGPRAREMGREWVEPITRRLGIPYLDLTAPLREAVKRSGKSHCFPDDGHFSSVGHAAAGEALAAFVQSVLKQPIPSAASGRAATGGLSH